MGKKRKRLKTLKCIMCIFMCAFVFFGTAEPSAVNAALPPESNDAGLQEKYDMSSPASEQTDNVQDDENLAVHSDEKGISVVPLFNMPHRAYEGHSVIMSDASGYRIDGEAADIKDIYANGIVWVEFAVQDEEQSDYVTIRREKCEKYQKRAVFSRPGVYVMEMTLHISDGSVYKQTQRINVDAAPDVMSVASGAKKQARLQRIEFKVAQNPQYPLEKLELELSSDNGAEKISVNMLENSVNSSKNQRTSHMITRNVECSADDDQCFVSGSIEFMSLYEKATQFYYSVTAVDIRGNSHMSDEKFTVVTDKAPVAAIDMSETYTREEKCRYAVVTAEDISSTDGDSLKREWFVKYDGESDYRPVSCEPGYTDMSDGSAARISFRKNGTGVFYVKLVVTDVWSEGTMDEYTSSSERLSDETERRCEVTNIAPRVSVGAATLKSADVIVIAPSDAENEEKTLQESFFQEFMSEGVESHMQSEYIDVSRSTAAGSRPEETFMRRDDYGYNGASTAFEDELYAVDNKNMYCVNAVWSDPDKGYPEEPYTVTASDAESGNEIWNYMITSDYFKLDTSRAFMYQDDSEKYLYIVSSGKTLVISKKAGVPVTILKYELGEYNYVNDDVIYTYKADGIYSVSLKDGNISKIWKGTINGASKRVNGLVQTYYRNSQDSVMKLMLDPETGKITEKYAGRLQTELFQEYSKKLDPEITFNTTGIDIDGRAVVEASAPLYYEKTDESLYKYKMVVQVYDDDCRLLKQEERTNTYNMKAFPVSDNTGRYNYAAISYEGHHNVRVEVFGIKSDYNSSATLSDNDGDPAVYDQIIYCMEQDGKIDITLGGLCLWIYDQTWANGPSHGMPERCKNLSFDIATGAAERSSLLAGCSNYSEYARRSDLYTVIHTARNSQYAGNALLDNNVVKMPQTTYDMLYRAISRNMRKGQEVDCKIILIKDENILNELSSDERLALIKKVSDAGYNVYAVTGGGNSADSDVSGIINYIDKSADITAEIIKNEIENSSFEERGYTEASVDAESGYIERNIELKDDTEYFYEYTMKTDNKQRSDASIEHSILPVLSNNMYNDAEWSVFDSETEDFNDDDINDFFSFESYDSAGGLYTDCRIVNASRNELGLERSSKISFDIPDGKQAVLSFDYIIFNEESGNSLNGNYFEIDGQRWNVHRGTTGNGNYTHPEILEPGHHELVLHIGAFGSKMTAYTYMDDLKVSYIKRGNSDINGVFDEDISGRGESTYKITGNFKTPGKATTYRELKGVNYISGEPGDAQYTGKSKADDSEEMYIELPPGKKALSASVKLSSYTPGKYNVTYTLGNFGIISHYGTVNGFTRALNQLPAEWKYILPTFEGRQQFNAEFNSYRGTKGHFSDVEMYVADGTNLLIEGHNYIKAQGDLGNTLFTGENMYGGRTSFRIELYKGISHLYDFKVYTIENGRRIYIVSDDFSDPDTILNWEKLNTGIRYGSEIRNDANGVNIFQKGQSINYNITYWDHEDDPSKQSFWKYTHTPANDGAFEQAATVLDNNGNIISESGIILNEPVRKFYKDGKYTVEHWQIDDTTGGTVEGGDPRYDKESNHVFITFYIGGLEDAPWIRYIKTVPSDVYEYDPVSIEVSFDDALKQILTLETTVYSGEQCDEIIYQKKISDITPANNKYEAVALDNVIPAAACGRYKVSCVLTSPSGVGIDSMSFVVMSRGNIEGTVYHTDKWDENRKAAGREKDVFWPGERLMLKADVEGSPVNVTAWIDGEDKEIYELSEAEEGVYRGSVWKEDMMFRWGSAPVDKKVIFRAEYKGGTVKMSEYNITLDNSRLYWNIHRTQGA